MNDELKMTWKKHSWPNWGNIVWVLAGETNENYEYLHWR